MFGPFAPFDQTEGFAEGTRTATVMKQNDTESRVDRARIRGASFDPDLGAGSMRKLTFVDA